MPSLELDIPRDEPVTIKNGNASVEISVLVTCRNVALDNKQTSEYRIAWLCQG